MLYYISEPKFSHIPAENRKLGSQLNMKDIFIKLIAQKHGRVFLKDYVDNAVASGILCDYLSFIRFQLFVLLQLKSKHGRITYHNLITDHGNFVDGLKRELESCHRILKMSLANWAAQIFIKKVTIRGKYSKHLSKRTTCIYDIMSQHGYRTDLVNGT